MIKLVWQNGNRDIDRVVVVFIFSVCIRRYDPPTVSSRSLLPLLFGIEEHRQDRLLSIQSCRPNFTQYPSDYLPLPNSPPLIKDETRGCELSPYPFLNTREVMEALVERITSGWLELRLKVLSTRSRRRDKSPTGMGVSIDTPLAYSHTHSRPCVHKRTFHPHHRLRPLTPSSPFRVSLITPTTHTLGSRLL